MRANTFPIRDQTRSPTAPRVRDGPLRRGSLALKQDDTESCPWLEEEAIDLRSAMIGGSEVQPPRAFGDGRADNPRWMLA